MLTCFCCSHWTVCVKNRKMLQTVKRLRFSSFFAHFFGEAIQDASGFPSGVVMPTCLTSMTYYDFLSRASYIADLSRLS